MGVRHRAWGMSPRAARLVAPRDPAASPAEQPGQGRMRTSSLGLRRAAIARAHPDQHRQPWCQDEARVGQQGPDPPSSVRTREVPSGSCRPAPGPPLSARRLPARICSGLHSPCPTPAPRRWACSRTAAPAQLEPGSHAVLVLDQAGWPNTRRLQAPANITRLPLPPGSPPAQSGRAGLALLAQALPSCTACANGGQPILDAACPSQRRSRPKPAGAPASPPIPA